MNARDNEAQDLMARVQRLPDRERLGVMTQLLRSLPPALLVDAWIRALAEAAGSEDPVVDSSPAQRGALLDAMPIMPIKNGVSPADDVYGTCEKSTGPSCFR